MTTNETLSQPMTMNETPGQPMTTNETPGQPMRTNETPSQRITREVTAWPGIEAGPGRRGEFAFRLGRREIGHLHGDHAAHFSFPKQLWSELKDAGRIVDHPVFPGRQGPAARRIETDGDVDDVIELLRINYDRLARTALAA